MDGGGSKAKKVEEKIIEGRNTETGLRRGREGGKNKGSASKFTRLGFRSGCGFLDGKLRSPGPTAVKYNCLK